MMINLYRRFRGTIHCKPVLCRSVEWRGTGDHFHDMAAEVSYERLCLRSDSLRFYQKARIHWVACTASCGSSETVHVQQGFLVKCVTNMHM